MNNTRQVLRFKTKYAADVINERINEYLKYYKFIQTDYNGEKVLKLDNLFAKQAFYNTYIKIFLTNDEITLIGWIKYKDTEYGFDDKLDFEDQSFTGEWEPIRKLYSIFWEIAFSYKVDDNVYCEKLPTDSIKEPEYNNLFAAEVKTGEDKNYSGPMTILVFLVMFCIANLVSIFGNKEYAVSSAIISFIIAFIAIIPLLKVAKDRSKNKTANIIFIVSICLILVCILLGVISLLIK